MQFAAVDILFAALVASIGVATGWFLRGITTRTDTDQNQETARAREVLARLREVAARVAADVGQHSARVEEINEELAGEAPETDAVVSAVDRLLQANQHMQKRLVSADERLREQARQIESHAAEARTDALTRLANRRALDDEMTRRLAEFERTGETFSVMIIDVDHFKTFNDTYGHQAGDAVLRGLADVLREHARPVDRVARYGGEEFVVILPGMSAVEAAARAEKIREAIQAAHFHFADTALQVTASLGVAQIQVDDNAGLVIKRSDMALYASKEAGRNCTHWHDGDTIHPAMAPNNDLDAGAEEVRDAAEPLASPSSSEAESTSPEPEPPSPKDAARTELVEPDWDKEKQAFHALLQSRMAEYRRGGVAPAVLLIHIDHYSRLTDQYGEKAGTLISQATSQFLDAALRDMDTAARYDQATFAIVLPGAGQNGALRAAERMREAIERCSLPAGDFRIRFTISAGGAEARENDDAPGLLQRAGEALEAAMESGGNCGYFHNGQWAATAASLLQVAQ